MASVIIHKDRYSDIAHVFGPFLDSKSAQAYQDKYIDNQEGVDWDEESVDIYEIDEMNENWLEE